MRIAVNLTCDDGSFILCLSLVVFTQHLWWWVDWTFNQDSQRISFEENDHFLVETTACEAF